MPKPFDNNNFAEYAEAIRKKGKQVTEAQDFAAGVVNLLFEKLKDDEGQEQCALLRFFRSMPFRELPQELKSKIQKSHSDTLSEQTKCLTLLATRGIQDKWNDPRLSEKHQCLVLNNEEFEKNSPMMSAVLKQLGLDINQVTSSEAGIFLEPNEKHYGIFYLPEAKGSPFVPFQEDFVIPYGIRSVIGFGTQLASGEVFIVLLFLRCFIEERIAKEFAKLSTSTELALLEIGQRSTTGSRILVAASNEGTNASCTYSGTSTESQALKA